MREADIKEPRTATDITKMNRLQSGGRTISKCGSSLGPALHRNTNVTQRSDKTESDYQAKEYSIYPHSKPEMEDYRATEKEETDIVETDYQMMIE